MPEEVRVIKLVEQGPAGPPGLDAEVTESNVLSALSGVLSTTGGNDKIPRYTATGNLVTGAFANNGTLLGDGGNIYIPDTRGIRWLKKNGTLSDASIFMWQDHDAFGGELIIGSPWRLAFISYGGIQVGPNDSGRYPRYLQLVSGYASGAYPALEYMPSGALIWQTNAWNGSARAVNQIIAQAKALDTTGTNSVLEFFDQATVNESGNNITAGRGDVTGNKVFEIYKDGSWDPGKAPPFRTLTDGATITWTVNKYHSEQLAKVTLEGNRTLAISGATAGMRGRLIVTQDGVGGRTLTLPAGSKTPNGGAGAITLTAAGNAVDVLEWLYDGTNYFWAISANLT